MDFANLFTLFTKSGMQQDPETHQFNAGIAEMSRLANNIQQQREDDEFFSYKRDEDF